MGGIRLNLFFVCLFLFGGLSAKEVPFLTNYVNDNAHILTPTVVSELNDLLASYEDSTSNQVFVLTISSLEGEALEPYANKVFNTWGVGQKELDNGVLLLVSKNDRKIRIEVGYGLESFLTDGEAGRIIRKIISPNFKKGDFDKGVRLGIHAILHETEGHLEASESSLGSKNKINASNVIITAFIVLAPFLLVFAIFGLFFYSFVHIIWERIKLYSYKKSSTGKRMVRIKKSLHHEFLTQEQLDKELLGSIKFHVWVTKDKSEVKVEVAEYVKLRRKKCPNCEMKVMSPVKKELLIKPTTEKVGKSRTTYTCDICGLTRTQTAKQNKIPKPSKESGWDFEKGKYTIPRKPKGSTYYGGGMSSGSGYSSGGFSGGGGGFSGGGGASGGW